MSETCCNPVSLCRTEIPDSSYINVPFLNLLGTLAKRSGKIQIRVGGNSQETAALVPFLADGRSIEKDQSRTYNPVRPSPQSRFYCTRTLTPYIYIIDGNTPSRLHA